MTERPIIFSGPMVRALFDGRKTMTRRLATSPLRKCEPGDRLWVRETWQVPALCDIQYRATDTARIMHWVPEVGPWRSPIHMPRWASRITLAVTEVKRERLQDITPADAIAEGISAPANSFTIDCDTPNPVKEFAALWDSLHGPDAWEANPEVVAISFRRIAL